MTKQEQINRGRRARTILEDSLFVEATTRVRDDIFKEIELTTWDDRERREFLDKELRALKRVVAYLKTTMINGDAASKQLREPGKLRRIL